MAKILIISAIGLLLSACTLEKIAHKADWFSYENETIGYRLNMPIEALTILEGEEPIDAANAGFGTYILFSEPNLDDYTLYMRGSSSGSGCSKYITGVSDPKNLSVAPPIATWGHMDFYQGRDLEGWEYPYDPKNILCKGEGIPKPESVYVLCSQKDEKTVVICINQMTDNPQLAEEIFSTFRWEE